MILRTQHSLKKAPVKQQNQTENKVKNNKNSQVAFGCGICDILERKFLLATDHHRGSQCWSFGTYSQNTAEECRENRRNQNKATVIGGVINLLAKLDPTGTLPIISFIKDLQSDDEWEEHGQKLFLGILTPFKIIADMIRGEDSFGYDFIGSADNPSEDLVLHRLKKAAKTQCPPIPFDCGNGTQLLTYPQMQQQLMDRIKNERAKVESQRDVEGYIMENGPDKEGITDILYAKYKKYLDNGNNNILDENRHYITDTYDPITAGDMKYSGRNIYFLTSFNFDPDLGEYKSGCADTDEISKTGGDALMPLYCLLAI